MVSALIGGALALAMSQLIATPSPYALLRGAAGTVLRRATVGMDSLTHALGGSGEVPGSARSDRSSSGGADGDTDAGQRATRDGLSALAGVAPMRDTAASISRHSLRGRRERPALRSFEARLAGIDELYAALLLMTATVPPAPGEHATRLHTLAPAVAELARALEVVAEQPTEAEAHPRAHAHAAAAACAARRPRRRRPGR